MKKYRIIAVLLAFCLMLSACSVVSVDTPQQMGAPCLKVHIIDVGQGDSSFIELPDGKTLLIDAGEREYGSVVERYIRHLGYQKIDYLVGTHPHSDHIGGLQHLVQSMDVGKIYLPRKTSTTATFENLLKAVQGKGLRIETARAGKTIDVNKDFSVDILSPVDDDYGDEMNLYSVVIKITYQKMQFLFMGDAETENEAQLQNVAAEFIRVGHHGSNTSSSEDFVNRVGAAIAVISVGKDNSYGLPKEHIVKRWEEAGASVYRTDEMGSMVFESDGNVIRMGKIEFAEMAAPKESESFAWVLNVSTKKIHYPDCSSVQQMKEENKEKSDKTIAQLIKEGYDPCGKCNPEG